MSALRLATGAARDMQRLARSQAVGSALRVAAEAQYASGDVMTARLLISEALSQLERGGHPFVLAKVYRSAGRITGNRAHGRAAQDIFTALRSSL